MKHKHSIGLIIPYFGRWPEWIELFFHSCELNSSINFIFFTDCPIPDFHSRNLIFNSISFNDYLNNVSHELNISFKPQHAYKLCDLKPFYGYIHRDILSNYDFYGFSDLDLLFGDIRKYYTDDLLDDYHVLSTHDDRVSGHLSLFRNTDENRMKVFNVPNWENLLLNTKRVSIDEYHLSVLYFPICRFNIFVKKILRSFIGRENVILINNMINKLYKRTNFYKKRKIYFKEQYTTPLSYIYWLDGTIHEQQPDVWFYKNGKITNNRDVDKEFIYLHFMNFKSGKFRKDKKTHWNKNFYHVSNFDEIRIDLNGISSIHCFDNKY